MIIKNISFIFKSMIDQLIFYLQILKAKIKYCNLKISFLLDNMTHSSFKILNPMKFQNNLMIFT